ncbi:type IV pilus modification PilV family protein [Marinobacterium stanieri]|uniref:type IV pilus modification PilV family protein n=1 Tax=Marinobacterium stanieri TaxID=49186 RepID=UPI0002557868|nr:prepilin-type N-terminal cleavage/methylation domain-containing protein [Marinobacterium stanieri]
MTRFRQLSAGFTLLEVLVAFVVLAAVLGVILRINAQVLEGTHRVSERQLALMLAQSQLDRVLANAELEPGQLRGDLTIPGYRWELDVFPLQAAEQVPDAERLRVTPYQIDLHVYWAEQQHLMLSTLRLGRPL